MPQPPNSQTTKSASNWVLHCTDTSIANRQISLLAILEVFIAMCLFGALAYHSPWPWFSLLACMSVSADSILSQGVLPNFEFATVDKCTEFLVLLPPDFGFLN
jgi:hypothetical protein